MKPLYCSFVFLLSACLSFIPARGDMDPEVRKQGEAAVEKGLAWLKSKQKDDGFFGFKQAPALTGLAVTAFSFSEEKDSDEARKAVDWMLTMVQPDGGIYMPQGMFRFGAGRSNYNTAICLTALHQSGRDDVQKVILGGRKFLAGAQQDGEHRFRGGFGYEAGGKKPYADLSSTLLVMEAMTLTRGIEDTREGERVEMDREAAAEYVSSLQHRPESNDAEWVMDDDANRGGFAYHVPNKPADKLSRREVRRLATYGSMTYAGILSLIYADVDRGDPRVRSALDWASKHWTLEENPGKGDAGYFYFVNILAKCLNTLGQDDLLDEKETPIAWREELVQRLVAMQRAEGETMGYWENEDNTYWEGNPILVTPYALIALQLALQE